MIVCVCRIGPFKNNICVSLFLLFPVVTKPPYEITETGWGEFEIIIKIFFIDPNERPVRASSCVFICAVASQQECAEFESSDLRGL